MKGDINWMKYYNIYCISYNIYYICIWYTLYDCVDIYWYIDIVWYIWYDMIYCIWYTIYIIILC